MKLYLSLLALGAIVSPLASALTNDEAAELVASKYGTKTNGWCVNAATGSGQIDKFQKINLFDDDADSVRVCYEYCLPFENEFGYVGMLVRSVSATASCACYFDDGTLNPALNPAGSKNPKQNGNSVGQVTGEGTSDKHACYPFKGYNDVDHAQPTGKPTPAPPPRPSGNPTRQPVPPTQSGGYCNWNNCNGDKQGGEWCNKNQSRCEGGCGGRWCTPPTPQPTPSPFSLLPAPSLLLKLDGNDIEVPNQQISYKSFVEDNRPIRDYLIDVDSTGQTASIKGNMWRAFELSDPLSIYEVGDFVVSFYFSLEEAGKIHGICFEENLIYANVNKPDNQENDSRRCLATAYFRDLEDVPNIIPTHYQTRVGGSHRYVLNLSKIFSSLYTDQNAGPYYKNLATVGTNGGLTACEGECDSDADCLGSLHCFNRGNQVEFVPGCDGVRMNNGNYCYDPDYYTKEFFMRYIVFISDEDRKDANGIRSRGESNFSNIEITTSLTSCLKDETNFSFSLSDCTADNFLAAIKIKMESTDACIVADKSDPLLELFAMFDATEEMDVYSNIEKLCTGAYKWAGYDVYDDTLGMDADTERQITREFLDGGSVWNYGKEDAGVGIDTAAIERISLGFGRSRLLKWPDHHSLESCNVGAAMCCTATSRDDSSNAGSPPNSEICYVDIASSNRSARVRDGYSIYSQDQTNDVYCEAFAWGTDGGSIQSALKGNALFQVDTICFILVSFSNCLS